GAQPLHHDETTSIHIDAQMNVTHRPLTERADPTMGAGFHHRGKELTKEATEARIRPARVKTRVDLRNGSGTPGCPGTPGTREGPMNRSGSARHPSISTDFDGARPVSGGLRGSTGRQ